MTAQLHVLIHVTTMQDCAKAKGLADWIYWTQRDASAMAWATK
jgi:hypothetical protein